MRVAISILLSALLGVLLAACTESDQSVDNAPAETVAEVQYFSFAFARGDNEFSVKQDFIITPVMPYTVEWQVPNVADRAYVAATKVGGGAVKIVITRDIAQSHPIKLQAVVKNSYGEQVEIVEKNIVVQQAVPEQTNVAWLSGSWGIRFPIPGGKDLTDSSDDWVAGARQIVDTFSSNGHIMSSFTANARGNRFLLRENPYVDIANEIHPDLVPAEEKDRLILDVIDVFKAADKKVILYLALDGPAVYMLQRHGGGNPEIAAAWQKFYTEKYAGDEGLAWRTLCKGFFERFKGKVDGYWLDHADFVPGELADFIAMMKDVDPQVAITVNRGKVYIKDSNDKNLSVAADGVKDPDDRQYNVIAMQPNDDFSDFTTGHPTPLAYGAPPNSWAYEEFTFAEAKDSAWVINGGKPVLRHWFGPIRETWNAGALVFDTEQAYRFVRELTDAGASLTWSNTNVNGKLSADEFKLLQEVDKRMQAVPIAPYQPYKRPQGAQLAGQ